jgi:hypothetical protein
MNRREPPLLATWTLEHLAAGDRDQALAGDLLEYFREGQSSGWYWHQVLSACAVSWIRALAARTSMLVFALAWSAAAPAWTAIMDRVLQNARTLGGTWQMDWPFSSLSRFGTWMGLNFTFLWSGILIYFVIQPRLMKSLSSREVRRPFIVGAAILLPIYFWTFILMNLFDYPGAVINRSTMGLIGEVIDVRLWANVIRVPYLLTLIFALWQSVPRFTRATQNSAFSVLPPAEPPSDPDRVTAPPSVEPAVLIRFFSLLVSAGLLNAMLAAVILCRLPNAHTPSVSSLMVRAIFYVITGAVAGVVGTWFYWRHPSCPFRDSNALPFSLFALVCAAGWVWVPPVVLFFEQVSRGAVLVAMIGALVLGVGLRTTTEFIFVPATSGQSWPEYRDQDLFANSLYRPPLDAHGYIIALGLYAAGAALLAHSNYTAAALLALTAFLFGWKITVPRGTSQSARQASRRAAMRLARVVIPAVLVTAWALLEGVAHRNHLAEAAALPAAEADTSHDAANHNAKSYGPGGFESLILWPTPPKKQIIAPIPAVNPLLELGSKRPLVIRFDGDYRYVQEPNQSPGPHAHKSHASPLQVNIQSNNGIGVFMNAHQELATPIPVSRCREIQVEVENEDNRKGMIYLGLLLKDTSTHQDPFYTGQQLITSTDPANFMIKFAPVAETLRFEIPAPSPIRKFDEITVVVLPDIEHQFYAPKIAIRQFELLPR